MGHGYPMLSDITLPSLPLREYTLEPYLTGLPNHAWCYLILSIGMPLTTLLGENDDRAGISPVYSITRGGTINFNIPVLPSSHRETLYLEQLSRLENDVRSRSSRGHC